MSSKLERESIIEKITKGSPNRLREKYFIKNNKVIYDEIMDYTSSIDVKFPFRIWHWVNQVESYVTCYCGNKVSTNMNWKDGYKKYCSNKCSANSEVTREKAKKTIKEKWGVEHYSKTDEYTKKVKKTSLERYGVDNYSKTDEYLSKSKKTYMEKYGVSNYTKTDDYLEKVKKTNLKRYGVEYSLQSKEVREKIKRTNLKKYGVDHIFKYDKYRNDISKNKNYLGFTDKGNKFNCDFGKNHIFFISTDDYYGRKKANNKLCTICNPISNSSSLKEKELFDYIKSIYDGKIIKSYRDKFEIDIYLPQLKIGIEFNGIYWHSEKFKDKNYHINKTNHFKEKGIRILHIWEDNWIYKEAIIKSQIKSWINSKSLRKIWARKTTTRFLSKNETKKFLDENHIQGNDRSNIELGLFYEGELVSLMTFNKSEGRKKMNKYGWNLSRFCNKLNSSVVGGASKLLSFFIKNKNPNRIISYADKDWSLGDLYEKIGFKSLYETKPDYKYVLSDKRIHKSRYRKSNLDSNLTESKHMLSIGALKIWDCGKIKFEKIIKNS